MSINKIQQMVEKLIVAADNHGEDDDPDHTVGDLQGLLRRAWEIMSVRNFNCCKAKKSKTCPC